MSISQQISRLQTLRNKLRTKLVAFGLVQSNADLDDCVTAVESIDNRGSVSASVKEGETYTIPRGFHSGAGTVSGVGGGGNYSLQSKTVTPTKSTQAITSDSGYYGLSDVTVEPIPENYHDVGNVTATSDDVLSGKIIVTADGSVKAGTMTNNGTISGQIDGITFTSFEIPSGYTSGGTVSLTDDIETALAAI